MTKSAVESSPKSKGRKHMLAHLNGKKLGRVAAMDAKCFECCNGFVDGRWDCEIEACPLYSRMPYLGRRTAA